ncbi:MAG: 50S ribosomal protein L24 [archaeon]
MVTCSFCRQNYEFPRGTTVVQKDGTVRYYCSSKCRKNSEMRRIGKKVKWIRKSEIVKTEKSKKEASHLVKKEAMKIESEKKKARKTKKKK